MAEINYKTRETIEKIKGIMEAERISLEEAVDRNFKTKSKSYREEWLRKNRHYFSQQEEEQAVIEISEEKAVAHVEGNSLSADFSERDLEALRMLLPYAKDLLKLVTREKSELDIPERLLRDTGAKNRSYRIFDDIAEEFSEVVKQYPDYKVTTLINFAIYEFIQKYKKENTK